MQAVAEAARLRRRVAKLEGKLAAREAARAQLARQQRESAHTIASLERVLQRERASGERRRRELEAELRGQAQQHAEARERCCALEREARNRMHGRLMIERRMWEVEREGLLRQIGEGGW